MSVTIFRGGAPDGARREEGGVVFWFSLKYQQLSSSFSPATLTILATVDKLTTPPKQIAPELLSTEKVPVKKSSP